MMKIISLGARKILNSNGNWTVEAEVETGEGVFKASVPSGTSKGKYEAVEIVPERAVENIERIIVPKLKGKEIGDQKEIDHFLIKLDGTENKSKLGANATLAVSIACLRAGAVAKKIPLYSYISQICRGWASATLPVACFNILNGGVHAGNDLDIQEFMIIPQMGSFRENLKIGAEIYQTLKKILEKRFGKSAVNLGDEGGFAPPLNRTKDALDLIMEAIKSAGYSEKVKIGLDCAASEFFKNEKYILESKKLNSEELLNFYQDLVKKYPILFFEDPFEQDDFKSFYDLRRSCQVVEKRSEEFLSKILIIGDDLTVTNPERIKKAYEKKACNGIILKPNQIGTVTETIKAAKLAKEFEWKIIVSHRSGDTCDDFIADLAVGIGADFIKSGAPARGERVAKYNRLLRIEQEVKEDSLLFHLRPASGARYMKKILFIILDGLGDRPIKELSNETPLEAARTPNFDFLASHGICGLIEPVYQGSFPSSKDAHLSLFGYDLKKWHMGRGVFEVLGIGMELGKEDIALRGNFGTVDSNFKIVDRRAGRISDTKSLVKVLQGMTIEGIKFLLGIAVSHRLGIILEGKHLSDKISDGDFHKTGIKAPKILAKENKREAKFTARVLNEFLLRSHQILEDHPLNKKRIKKGQLPANYILVREAGKLKKLQSFEKKWGLRACCIAGGVLYKGIARVLGMDLIKVRGATGKADTDLEGKFKTAKKSLEKYDFCYLHIKATDIFSHDGDFLGKKKFLEKIDRNLSILLNLKNTLIVVTGDHSTPCKVKEHTADPLPVLVFGLGKDGVKKFSEKECQKGKIGKIKSTDFMGKILSCNF